MEKKQERKLDERKRKKKKSDGWSWFERVHIGVGDESEPINMFNNSANFGALTADGGNLATGGMTGGMGVGEALESLREESVRTDSLSLFARYLVNDLLEYNRLKYDIRELNSLYYSLKNSNHIVPAYLKPTIDDREKRLKAVTSRIIKNTPSGMSLESLVDEFSSNIDYYVKGGNKLSQDELKRVEQELEGQEQKRNAPKVGQRFRYYSFVPTVYEVKKVDNNIVYYSVVGENYLSRIPVKDFLDEKKKNNIWFV